MERVAFLIESSGDRITAMLNPETLVVRRLAGIRSRVSESGNLAGRTTTDDPLLFTGGGTTELTLDLLFDVNVAGSTIETQDVRDLTEPFRSLAENVAGEDGLAASPAVTFVWGKAWNITGVVTATAERLEFFNADGAARRSRLRMRLVRTPEPAPMAKPPIELPPADDLDTPAVLDDEDHPLIDTGPENQSSEKAHQVLGGETISSDLDPGDDAGPAEPPGPPGVSDRLDSLAARYFGDASKWRLLAAFNRVIDPLRLMAGQVLRIPDKSGDS